MIERFYVDKKFPIIFSIASLLFLYLFQWPLNFILAQLLDRDLPYYFRKAYSFEEWFVGYSFIVLSSFVVVVSVYVGLSIGNSNKKTIDTTVPTEGHRLSMWIPWILWSVSGLWSWVMLQLKVGMTIYNAYDPMPFKIIGILFYGRLLLQPLLLAFVSYRFRENRKKWVLFLLFFLLSIWVTLSSGSRFIGIVFSFWVLFLIRGRMSYLCWAILIYVNINCAGLSRVFFLPHIIGGIHTEIYANDEMQEGVMDDVWWEPVLYVVGRTMGVIELLQTIDSELLVPVTLKDFFTRTMIDGALHRGNLDAVARNIHGKESDITGGWGLDVFSSFWVTNEANMAVYLFAISITGILMGHCFRIWSLILFKIQMEQLNRFIFPILFMIFIEYRLNVLWVICVILHLINLPFSIVIIRKTMRHLRL